MSGPTRRSPSATASHHPSLRRALGTALAAAAVTATIAACSSGTVPDPDSPGAAIFASNCASCHGTDLRGGVGPDLIGAPLTEEQVRTAIEEGPGSMPAFGERLSETEQDDVVGYVLRQNTDPAD